MVHPWISSATKLISDIENNGKVPYKNHIGQRSCGVVSLCLCCSPCCFWSVVWRCIACPCMCFSKGCGFICSNNGCTDVSDDCIGTYWNDVYENTSLPVMPPASEFNKEELADFVNLMTGKLEKTTYSVI